MGNKQSPKLLFYNCDFLPICCLVFLVNQQVESIQFNILGKSITVKTNKTVGKLLGGFYNDEF